MTESKPAKQEPDCGSSEGATETETHDTEDQCIEAEAFLGDEADEPELIDDGQAFTEKRTCPVCGREWEYVFDMVGLWNPREKEYEWEK
jgi:hypothetical protein